MPWGPLQRVPLVGLTRNDAIDMSAAPRRLANSPLSSCSSSRCVAMHTASSVELLLIKHHTDAVMPSRLRRT